MAAVAITSEIHPTVTNSISLAARTELVNRNIFPSLQIGVRSGSVRSSTERRDLTGERDHHRDRPRRAALLR